MMNGGTDRADHRAGPRGRKKYLGYGIGLVFLFLLPLVVKQSFYLHMIIITYIWIILASGLNLLSGYAGQVSLGHASFYGIGAYTSVLLTLNLGWPFWLALPASGLMAGLVGLLVGYPALRTRGIYFSVVTLGMGIIFSLVMDNWISLTRGPMGIPGVPPPTPIGGLKFDSRASYYYLVLVVMIIAVFAIHRLVNSRFGDSLKAIREKDMLAEVFGVNAMRQKVCCFVISTFIAGIAGSLYAHYALFVSPVSFSIGVSFEILIIVIVGGLGTMLGPVLATVILISLPEVLRAASEYRELAYGFVLILIIMFAPRGLAGLYERLMERVARVEAKEA